jgi:hypothetical protein
MARYLFIVAREHPDLWAHLAREFSGEAGVEVVLDRRTQERRRLPRPPDRERRQANRRARPPIDNELSSMNFALVPTE